MGERTLRIFSFAAETPSNWEGNICNLHSLSPQGRKELEDMA